ncbi:Rhodanese-like domain-containing protein [Microdochium trichocladiopsis]|uniref:Rhodanese-like domain-containing protein n=1 Tax=Microdochium trichocladiopsis TaxID=1682393 RepID=A0A9P8Y6W1_9PEZI|nr:Rhodanese-like domain-containing protein [Microdochium trichocladiopsis]KAH7031374.1 Rhodanese-like domain-containing protein [Microdochium trichocladiopsis]
MTTNASNDTKPWHAAFPAPRTTEPGAVSREEMLELLRTATAGKDYVLVDLRRNDYEGGTIKTSINLPAQSLYPTIPALYKLFETAGVKQVIWYCGSSSGRGTRAAGWFQDYIDSQGGEVMRSVILQGGIKGWVAAGAAHTAQMDGFVAEAWQKPVQCG